MKPIKIVLAVRHQGHCPSFKNTKQIARNRKTGRQFLMTNPKKKAWMDQCIQSFTSQLECLCQITGAGILTAPPPRSLIALSLPVDDSRQWITRLTVEVEVVKKGNEGAVVIIEPT